MAKTTTCPITQNIKNAFATLVNATGAVSGESGTSVTNLVTVYTAGSNDAVVKSLVVTSSDSSARTLNIYINNGTYDYLLAAITIPATSGGASGGTTVNVDILGSQYFLGLPFDQSGKPVLPLQTGYVLKAGVQVAVTAAKTVTVSAIVEEY